MRYNTGLFLVLLSLVPGWVQASAFDDFRSCKNTMENGASYELMKLRGVRISQVYVLRFELLPMPPMMRPGADTHRAEVALTIPGGERYYFQVYSRQPGPSMACEVTKIEALDPSAIDPVVAQAETYKRAIRDAEYTSEADMPWEVFYSRAKVDRKFPLAQIRVALNAGDQYLGVLNHSEVLTLLDAYTGEDVEFETSIRYKALKKALLKDFSELRGYRVGEPDSGEIQIFVVGRARDGRLVGLRTISVET